MQRMVIEIANITKSFKIEVQKDFIVFKFCFFIFAQR